MIGERIGSYQVVRQLGKGGIGVVYLAEHASLGSRAVVKTLLPQYGEDKEALARFFNEAKAATAIKHPGIVTIFDYGEHAASGSAYIVMEHLDGEVLADRIRRGPLAPMAAAAIARQTASVVGAAHRAGIIHRDLKPDNLIIVPDPDVAERERVKVLDFGIAKLADAGTSVKTQTTSVMGTPLYMSPEQCHSAAGVDGRADIYALGCILYEMLTGRPPFLGTSMAQLVTCHLFEAPVPPGRIVAGIPPALERTVLRALAKAPGDRQADMREVTRELDAVIATSPVAPPSETAVATAVVAVAAPASPLGTTLSRSVRAIEAPKTAEGSRRALVIGVTAAVLVVGVATFAIVRGRVTSGAASSPPAASVPTAPASAPPPPLPPPPATTVVEPIEVEPPAPASAPPPAPPAVPAPATGQLAITSRPPADIVVDGRRTGLRTPQTAIALAAGRHKITLVDAGARVRETFTVRIRAGRVERVDKDLTRRPVAPAPDVNKATINPFDRKSSP